MKAIPDCEKTFENWQPHGVPTAEAEIDLLEKGRRQFGLEALPLRIAPSSRLAIHLKPKTTAKR